MIKVGGVGDSLAWATRLPHTLGGNVYPRDVYPRNMGFGKCGLLWLNSLCGQVVSGYQIDEEGYAVLSKVHGSSSV